MKHEIEMVKQAYIDCYPLLGMYALLQEQLLDDRQNAAAFNEFSHTAQLATPETTFIPAPNNDTTYSRAWLDLRNGPVIIETPDTKGRYYTIQLLDMFTETVDNLGKRLYGTQKHRFMILQRDHKVQIPSDVIPVFVDSYYALAFLRILIGSENQLEEVKQLQKAFQIDGKVNDDMIYPVYTSEDERTFFQAMQELLVILAPSYMVQHEQEIVREVLDFSDEVLQQGVVEAKRSIEEGGMQFGEAVHNWRVAIDHMGRYGKHHHQRAVVWHKGALANVPEESLYPSTFQDEMGELLEGSHVYTLTFSKGNLPPVSQFWSITMYQFENGFLVDNPIHRYSIGDRTKDLVYAADGSLTIYIQASQPETDAKLANWLPSPQGKFYISMRLYGPDQDILNGEWKPPYVKRARS